MGYMERYRVRPRAGQLACAIGLRGRRLGTGVPVTAILVAYTLNARVKCDLSAAFVEQVRAAPHVRAEADAEGRSLAPLRSPFEEHQQVCRC